ncbi:MAG TPA: glycosyltransferase family 2 protein [Terriglobales bacterium]|nr:glycosyltransferase family 2 protein [Terriglobales bacterium]
MISVAIPVYNEEELVHLLHSRVSDVMNGIGENWEVVYVNDGSKDATLKLLLELQAKDPHIVVVDLSRNWGHMGALSAGMQTARGDAVVLMDGDLQDPPEVIPEMVRAWRNGAKVVSAVRRKREESRKYLLVLFALFYRILGALSDFPIPLNSGIFGLMDRQALDSFLALREYNRYLPGLRAWIGYPTTIVSYDRKDRAAGDGKLSFVSRIKYALDAITSFSYKPLRLSFALGIPAICLALITALALAVSGNLTGTAAILASVFFMGGVQLFCVGVLAEYIGRIYDEVRRRPISLINAVHRAQEVPSEAGQEVLPAAA